MLNKRQEIFQNVIEGKLRVQDRASEIMQDQIIEEMKELVHTKTEETLQLAEKEHDLLDSRRRRHGEAQALPLPRMVQRLSESVI